MTEMFDAGRRCPMPLAAIAAAAGLIGVLSGCAGTYDEVCAGRGAAPGSAAFQACIQEQAEIARVSRTRHLKYGAGR